MGWITFKLGRPGYEFNFEVPPGTMDIQYNDVKVMHQDLAGNLHKSTLKAAVPTIRMRSDYLTLVQRNQFHSLRHITDDFLSFQCRDDWQVYYDPSVRVKSTIAQLQETSATRLSARLVALGLSSIITPQKPFTRVLPTPGGGSPTTFDPGAITYDDSTRQITMANSLATTEPLYVNYVYKGWYVELNTFTPTSKGGWLDRSTYDIELVGA